MSIHHYYEVVEINASINYQTVCITPQCCFGKKPNVKVKMQQLHLNQVRPYVKTDSLRR